MKTSYFDYAAATPMDPAVLQAMQPYFADKFYNPSAIYLAARAVNEDIAQARASVAHWLGMRPSEVYFLAGGTEANNTAIHGVMSQYQGANIVVSAVEHDSVLMAAGQYNNKLALVDDTGRLDLSDLRAKIDDHTVMVSVMYANNEIGTLEPIAEVSQIIKQIRLERAKNGNKLPLYLHTDACQAANYLKLFQNSLGYDMITVNGGKIYGPKQSAVLAIRAGILINPLIVGGGQENGLRSGTENVPAIIGFAKALDIAQNMREAEQKRLAGLQKLFIDQVQSILPEAVINGSRYRLPNNVHLTFPGVDNERLMMELDERGLIVAVGSACSASSDEPSHVLTAIGKSDQAARSSIRISFGRQTTEGDVNRLLKALAALIDK